MLNCSRNAYSFKNAKLICCQQGRSLKADVLLPHQIKPFMPWYLSRGGVISEIRQFVLLASPWHLSHTESELCIVCWAVWMRIIVWKRCAFLLFVVVFVFVFQTSHNLKSGQTNYYLVIFASHSSVLFIRVSLHQSFSLDLLTFC